MRLTLVTIVVDDYDQAIGFFTGVLGFGLVEDSPSLTNDGLSPNGGSWSGRQAPRPASCWLRRDGPRQAAVVGHRAAGRVGFFLRVGRLPAPPANA